MRKVAIIVSTLVVATTASLAASPVSDLDEPLPAAADAANPSATREESCALYESAKGNPARIKEAYDLMRAAARLGDPDAALYLAKYLYSGTVIQRDRDAAEIYIRTYVVRSTQNARSSAERASVVSRLELLLALPTCGPPLKVRRGGLHTYALAPGLVMVPVPKALTGGTGGFLSAPQRPEVSEFLSAARTFDSARASRLHACRLYRTADADPLRILEAYIHMRTAADCGDDDAALHVSAYLRTGMGPVGNIDLANHFLRRVLTRGNTDEEWNTLKEAFHRGECAPVDPDGQRLLGWLAFTPLN